MARHVNFVWNYVNELSHRSIKERGVFLSAYDIHPYTKKARLNWRKSGGVRRSLGWIPINTAAAQWKNGQVFHNGHYFKVWDTMV